MRDPSSPRPNTDERRRAAAKALLAHNRAYSVGAIVAARRALADLHERDPAGPLHQQLSRGATVACKVADAGACAAQERLWHVLPTTVLGGADTQSSGSRWLRRLGVLLRAVAILVGFDSRRDQR